MKNAMKLFATFTLRAIAVVSIQPDSSEQRENRLSNSREKVMQNQEAQRMLARATDDEFVAALRHVLEEYAVQGRWLSINQAAELAGLKTRSFQRRLDAQDISFSTLVEQVRRQRATELLNNSECLVSEIAYQLGYSTLANFDRAFLRWTGKTPTEIQNENQADRKT
jgi:AraC-like DNA-binding protein